MNRKSFLKALLVSIPAVTLIACSDDEPAPTSGNNGTGNGGGTCASNGTNSSISTNHGHSLTVSSSDVQNGTAKTYQIQGSSGHMHTVEVTAANFASLQSGQSINVTSSTDDNHSHRITVSCA